jgi:hypothetical protein
MVSYLVILASLADMHTYKKERKHKQAEKIINQVHEIKTGSKTCIRGI